MKFNILASITALLLSACSLIDDRGVDCPAYPVDGDENITISFNMLTSDPLVDSRADGLNHEEVESELTSFEDGVQANDLAMFIFVKKASDVSGEEKVLLKYIRYNNYTYNQTQVGTVDFYGFPGSYIVNMTINKNQFADFIGSELNPDDSDNIQFRVLIMANCYTSGTSQAGKWSQVINLTTYTQIIDKIKNWKYTISYLYNINGDDDADAAELYTSNGRGMPMFGSDVYSVTQRALYESRVDNVVYLGELDLLRAFAKVRVIDNIQNKDINGYPKIIGASIYSSQTDAYMLPELADYVNGSQVHSARIANPGVQLNPTPDQCYKLGVIPSSMVVDAQFTGDVRIGYIPEQKIANINNDVNQGMPMFRIKVALQENADGTLDTKEYDVPMTGYNNQEFTFGDNILRNHIYTLSVNEVSRGAEAKVELSIEDWTPVEQTLDYTETVTVSPVLEWNPTTYQSIDNSKGIVEVKPWSSMPVPLIGNFGLQTPVGAKWTAYLISTGGVQDAFCFSDNGNETQTMSGVIDGSSNFTLPIVSTVEAPNLLSSAILQVIVTLGNGTVLEVPLAPEGASFKNYTIVQNPQ